MTFKIINPFQDPARVFKEFGGVVDPSIGEAASSPWVQNLLDPTGSAQIQTQQYAKRLPALEQLIPNYISSATQAGARPGVSLTTTEANQARAAQMALVAQMRAQAQGPSLAAMQGQQALAQGGQQALRAAAMGQPGRASMLGMAQAGAGMGADVARARLAEQMRSQAGLGGVAAGLRSMDVRQGGLAAQTALQSQAQKDRMVAFYLSQGLDISQAQQRANIELESLYNQMRIRNQQDQLNAVRGAAQTAAPVVGMAATGGPK